MSPISIGILAVSMSIDAFIASVGKGASSHRPKFIDALKTGAVFGLVETITPLLGWLAGVATSQYVAAVDHWIAFLLLAAVGGHMILQSTRDHAVEGRPPVTFWAILGTAIGTSIDAMAVGVSLAFLDVNIVVIALAIGFVTMVMSSTGMMAGHLLGRRFGRIAEALGGVALIALGGFILFEHLTA